MISISSITGSDDFILFEEDPTSDLELITLRVSRSATLDGGGVLDKQGYSPSDRTLRILAELDETQIEKLQNLAKNYEEHNISFKDGFYFGALERVNFSRWPIQINFLIEGVYE